MYEATPVANFYTSLGYLNSIVAALGFSFLPRAKFLQMSILNAVRRLLLLKGPAETS